MITVNERQRWCTRNYPKKENSLRRLKQIQFKMMHLLWQRTSLEQTSRSPPALPDAIPACDLIYRSKILQSHTEMITQSESPQYSAPPPQPPFSITLDNAAFGHVYENLGFENSVSNEYAIPDLLDLPLHTQNASSLNTAAADNNLVPSSSICQPYCICQGRSLTPHLVQPPRTFQFCSDRKPWIAGLFDKRKAISFKRRQSTNAVHPDCDGGFAQREVTCQNCNCFLDPVEMNAFQLQQHSNSCALYENVLMLSVLNNRLYDMQTASSTDRVGRNADASEWTACHSSRSRNKFNLRIDTEPIDKQTAAFSYYDYFMNSPILKKLRDSGFTYPGRQAICKRYLIWIVVVLVLTVLFIITIISNFLVAKYFASISNQNSNSNCSYSTAQARIGDLNANDKFLKGEIESTTTSMGNRIAESAELGSKIADASGSATLHGQTDVVIVVTGKPIVVSNSEYAVESTPVPIESPASTTTFHSANTTAGTTLSDFSVTAGSGRNLTAFVTSTTPGSNANGMSAASSATASSHYSSATAAKSHLSQMADNSSAVANLSSMSTWLPTYPVNVVCDEDKFRCRSGVSSVPCLDLWNRCDGIQDCSDGSDEEFCDELNCYGNFHCNNSHCVALEKVCDGVADCEDRSDEVNCDHFECKPYEFRCATGYCIPTQFVCDGDADCPSHDDEFNCSKSCEDSHFLCAEGWCIPSEWRCNGRTDCSAGEDEENCTCSKDKFRCLSGGCVPQLSVCDGIAQCLDKSDEWQCLSVANSTGQLAVQPAGLTATRLAVCADQWSVEHSDLVCRQMGYRQSVSHEFVPISHPQSSAVLKISSHLPNIATLPYLQFLLRQTATSECKSSSSVRVHCDKFECGNWSIPAPEYADRTRRMIGGQVSDEHQWPAVALLIHPRIKWVCTATVLSPWWLATSALCVRRTDWSTLEWKLIAGNAEPSERQPNAIVRSVREFRQHPSYKRQTLLSDYDVMLVQLDAPLPFDNKTVQIQPACLPNSATEPGSWCVTAGWGYSIPGGYYINKVLRHLDMGVWSKEACNGTDHYSGLITEQMICAWNQRADWGPCFNDEGSPLLCLSPTSRKWYLAGVLSSHSCGSAKHPAIYADVLTMRQWIANSVGTALSTV